MTSSARQVRSRANGARKPGGAASWRATGNQPSFGERVYGALRAAILSGQLSPGTALREEDLSARFDVSRTPVREALKKLEAGGLIVHEGRTLVVARPTLDEVMDSYEIRANLAALSARLAAERATETDLVELEILQRRCERSGLSSERAAVAMMDFDRAVWKASKNAGLAKLLEELESWQNRFAGNTLTVPGRLRSSVAEHRALLGAIGSRDAAKAEQISIEHMRRSRDTRMQMTLNKSFTRAGARGVRGPARVTRASARPS